MHIVAHNRGVSLASSDNNTFEGEVPTAYITAFPVIKEIDMSYNALSGFDQDTVNDAGDMPKLERLILCKSMHAWLLLREGEATPLHSSC